MMKPEDITVGMSVRCGIDRPRTATVIGLPKQAIGGLRVRIRFITGEEYDSPLSLLMPLHKRPSARRVTLKDVVSTFERNGGTLSERERELLRKVRGGK